MNQVAYNVVCSICDLPLQSVSQQYHLLHPIKNTAHHVIQSHLSKHHVKVWQEIVNQSASHGLLEGAIQMRQYVRSERID
jgi:hypothetical protein